MRSYFGEFRFLGISEGDFKLMVGFSKFNSNWFGSIEEGGKVIKLVSDFNGCFLFASSSNNDFQFVGSRTNR